jgi:outer membrane protein assembly factor BamB
LKLSKSAKGVDASEVYYLEAKTLQNHHGGMVLVDGKIYTGHGQNRGFPTCLDLATGKVVWGGDIRNEGSGSAAVVYADGNLIYRYQNGRVLLVEASPAGYKEKGSFQIPDVKGPSWPYPVVAGGKLYLREADTIYCYNVRS